MYAVRLLVDTALASKQIKEMITSNSKHVLAKRNGEHEMLLTVTTQLFNKLEPCLDVSGAVLTQLVDYPDAAVKKAAKRIMQRSPGISKTSAGLKAAKIVIAKVPAKKIKILSKTAAPATAEYDAIKRVVRGIDT